MFWPEIQARSDMPAGSLTAIARDKQEYLCRLLKRPSLLLVDHSGITTSDTRKQQSSANISPMKVREQSFFSSLRRSNRIFVLEREFSEDECHLSLVTSSLYHPQTLCITKTTQISFSLGLSKFNGYLWSS